MRSDFPRSSPYLPSCCSKDPTVDGAIIKASKDARTNPAQEASSAADVQSANKSSRCYFPSWLQKLYVEKKKTDTSHFTHLMRKIDEIEGQVIESLRKDFTQPGKDIRTIAEFNNLMLSCTRSSIYTFNEEFNSTFEKNISRKFREKLESLKSEAIDRFFEAADKTSLSSGWRIFHPEESNLIWESGPLLIKRGLSLQQLKLDQANIASGKFGSVSVFKNENGDELIGKIVEKQMHNFEGEPIDGLGMELKAYQTIYQNVGLHPNLINVYGITEVPYGEDGEERKRTMFMDMIPGPSGDKTFDTLNWCLYIGEISKKEYWGVVQFIGRRLFDVTEHIGKAEVVHSDIKPENIIVNEKTGEPVLIDFGVWCKKGELPRGGALNFIAPEVHELQGVDERSDVFAVGVTLWHCIKGGVESGCIELPIEDSSGSGKDEVHEEGDYSVEIAYMELMHNVLEKNKDFRVDSKGAKELDFLSHRILDDDSAKELIKKVMSLAGK